MQKNTFLRAVAPFVVVLAGCSPAVDNPYASIKDPPVVEAKLHTVTFQSADTAVIDRRVQAGYTRMPPATNYPGGVRVEAALWKVPEEVAAAPVMLIPAGGGTNERYLVMTPAAPVDGPQPEVVRDFYRNVLGDAAAYPAAPDSPRIHSLTYVIDDVLAAKKKLREAGIPITFDAVAITTAYLGDHKLLGITAPDGVIVELVETAAQ